MREYRYRAVTPTGQMIEGVRRASNREDLNNELLDHGLVLIGSRPTLGSLSAIFSAAVRAGRRELRDFTEHMAISLDAGIPSVTALADFEHECQGAFRSVVADLRNDINSGARVDEAFARYPDVFNEVYLAMVAAGQRTGTLDRAFGALVDYLAWHEDLRSRTVQLLIYPTILVCGVLGLFLLLTLFVVPRFESVFTRVDFELPALTRQVLNLTSFMGDYWPLLLGGVIAAVVGYKLSRRSEQGRYRGDWLLLRVPVVGDFVAKLALSRFTKQFAVMFASGTDLLSLLDLLQRAVGNAVLSRELRLVRKRVATGETLRASISQTTLFPPLIQRLIGVGEKTGSLDQTMEKASAYYDREIPRALQRAFSLFQALVVVALGVLVCLAALSLLMPIMEIRARMWQ